MTRVRGTVGRAERAEALQCALQCLPVLDRRRDDPDRHRQEEPDVVTAQLDKLVPLLEESWTSSDGPRAGVKDAALGWGIVSPYDALTMTLDPNRPGPALPGHSTPPPPAPPAAVGPVVIEEDTTAGPRQVGLWIAFGAVAAAAGLRLVQVLRRRSEQDREPASPDARVGRPT